MKPELRIGFCDTFLNCELFFTDILSKRYIVIRDDMNPHYLIYGDTNFGQKHHLYDRKNVTKIFYTGENVRPNYADCDYAITFDHVNSLSHYRLPLYALEMWAIVHENKFTEDYNYLQGLHKKFDWEKEYDSKITNITYVQSNPYCATRTNLVKALISVGANIKCGGPHLNNMGEIIPRNRLSKMKFLREGKINIAMENGSYPGYVTEKILDAFYSCTLPFYWGSATIGRDFNPKCFKVDLDVNASTTTGVPAILSALDKKKWCEKMSQPRFNYDIPNDYCQIDNFVNWFDKVVYHGG